MTSRHLATDPALNFMRLIWAVDHELQSLSKRMEVTHGLTVPQRMALLLIGRKKGVLASELASLLHLHPGTISGVITRLEAARLVVRKSDASDARRFRLELSAAGRAANKRRAGTFEAAVRRVLAESSAAEIESTRQVLTRLAQQLQPRRYLSASIRSKSSPRTI